MTSNDIAAVAHIEKQCFSDAWSEKMISDLPDSVWDEVWIQENGNGEPAGYINFRFVAGEGELMRIAVLPQMRGQGYARKLMDTMVESASRNSVSDITLEVRAGNEPAIGLYKSYGFITVAVRKGYYRSPAEDALIMRLGGLPSIPT